MSRLAGRIRRLERLMGDGDGPRIVTIWSGPRQRESWVERNGGGLDFHVRMPCRDDDPMEHLPGEMRDLLRPEDSIRTIELADNPRDRHFQRDVPPWNRRPWRMSGDGRAYELQGEDGDWRRHESP